MQLKWVLILKNTNGFDFASGYIKLILRMVYHYFFIIYSNSWLFRYAQNREVADTCKWCLMSVDGIKFQF